MPAQLHGFDQYTGSARAVTITRAAGHVLLEVEDGASMLTPDEARAVAAGLYAQADNAVKASELSGTFDLPGGEQSIG